MSDTNRENVLRLNKWLPAHHSSYVECVSKRCRKVYAPVGQNSEWEINLCGECQSHVSSQLVQAAEEVAQAQDKAQQNRLLETNKNMTQEQRKEQQAEKIKEIADDEYGHVLDDLRRMGINEDDAPEWVTTSVEHRLNARQQTQLQYENTELETILEEYTDGTNSINKILH